jgi:hypothetical protein
VKTKAVFQTNLDGLFLYETIANELALQGGSFNVPYGAVESPPPQVAEGHVARWTGAAWESVEDHRAETLYVVDTSDLYTHGSLIDVGGEQVAYAGWGPVPDWLTTTAPVAQVDD